MLYKIYGEKFREIRNQKQLSLSYFEGVGVDKSDLSKFERGKRMIGFERVDAMLQLMDVSLAEYELIINNFVPNFQEVFLNEIDEADFNQKQDKLTKLYEEVNGSGYGVMALAVKARYDKLTQEEIGFILDALEAAWIAVSGLLAGPLGAIVGGGVSLLGAGFFIDLGAKIVGALSQGKGIMLTPQWSFPPIAVSIK